jgi:hypothetical protein
MENKSKEGISVKELEGFAKKYRFEVFFCLLFVFTCFFSFVFFGAGWAVILGSIGGIIGTLIPVKIESFVKSMFRFVFKQETTTQLILGAVALIVAIFLPPLIFLLMGLNAGKHMHQLAMESYSQNRRG